MGDFSFLAVPNIEGMRFLRYLKLFGIGLLFGVCLFFLLYFIVKYRREKTFGKQLSMYDQKTALLEQDLFVQKTINASGKSKILLFIEYLEKFGTTNSYANISELLLAQWFITQEIQEIEGVLYANQKISKQLETQIDERMVIKK